jgi:hypothetical protein
MLLKSFYYLYFVLWRLCRASKDKSFGELRVNSLLMLIEAHFVSGLLYLLMWGRIGDINLVLYVVSTVVPLLVMNMYLFGSELKRSQYEREFVKYSQDKRRKADMLAVLAFLGAILVPFIIWNLIPRA